MGDRGRHPAVREITALEDNAVPQRFVQIIPTPPRHDAATVKGAFVLALACAATGAAWLTRTSFRVWSHEEFIEQSKRINDADPGACRTHPGPARRLAISVDGSPIRLGLGFSGQSG